MENNSKKDSMIKKTIVYFAGNFSNKIFGLIIIPIYARYLTASELGQYDFQLTIANLLMPILVLAIWESVLRFGLVAEWEKKKEIITTSIYISGITLTISFVVLMSAYINLYGSNLFTYMYVCLIITLPIINLLGYIVRSLKKSKVYVMSGAISGIVNMISILVFVVYLQLGLGGILTSTIIANIFNIVYLIFGGKIYIYIHFRYFSKDLGKQMVIYSTPLIANLVFGWFVNSFSRFYINLSLGLVANGIYAFANKFSGMLFQLSSVINMSAVEDAFESIGSKSWVKRYETNFKNISNFLFHVSYLLLPIVSSYYVFLSNNEFKSSLTLVPMLFCSTLFIVLSTLIGNVFSVFNKTSLIFVTSFMSALVNIFFSIVLGYFFSLHGIVFAQVLSGLTLFITRYFMGIRIQKYHLGFGNLVKNMIVFILISILILLNHIGINIMLIFAVAVYILWFYKKNIYLIFKKIRGRFR